MRPVLDWHVRGCACVDCAGLRPIVYTERRLECILRVVSVCSVCSGSPHSFFTASSRAVRESPDDSDIWTPVESDLPASLMLIERRHDAQPVQVES